MQKFCSFALVAGQEIKDLSRDEILKKSSAEAELNRGKNVGRRSHLHDITDLYGFVTILDHNPSLFFKHQEGIIPLGMIFVLSKTLNAPACTSPFCRGHFVSCFRCRAKALSIAVFGFWNPGKKFGRVNRENY